MVEQNPLPKCHVCGAPATSLMTYASAKEGHPELSTVTGRHNCQKHVPKFSWKPIAILIAAIAVGTAIYSIIGATGELLKAIIIRP
jgi:hypothetical protein